MLQVSPEAEHLLFQGAAAFWFLPIHVVAAWYGSDRRYPAGISERPHRLEDEATGKLMLELLDARFASASLYALPTQDRPLSLAASCEESRVAYAPAYFVGNWTVSRLRPFLRRRLRTSRPHLVAIRNLKPCVRMRRLLRGR
jgi:hypothetical protein